MTFHPALRSSRPVSCRAAGSSSTMTTVAPGRTWRLTTPDRRAGSIGLVMIVGGAEHVAGVPVVGHRDHDDRDVGDVAAALERAQHRPAVHLRHDHVEGDDGRLQLARQLQRLRRRSMPSPPRSLPWPAGATSRRGRPRRRRRRARRLRHRQRRFASAAGGIGGARPASARGSTLAGSSNRKVEPTPGVLSTSMWPPIISQ